MSNNQDLDFTAQDIPQSWHEAAEDAPSGDPASSNGRAPIGTVPLRQSVDMFSAILTGTIVSLVVGYLWLYLETTETMTTRLTPLGVAILITLAVRAGGGHYDALARSALSFILFAVTTLATIYLISRSEFAELYGSAPDVSEFERDVLQSRVKNPVFAMAWIAGAALTIQLSHLTAGHRS